MAAAGINACARTRRRRRWLLDLAAEHGLRVMAGLPWEQHVAFLERPRRARVDRAARARARCAPCAGHPALLAYAIGNEIPAPIVRWHGRRAIERFLERLYPTVKDEDPEGLVTYVNFPTTEYLQLPFVDLASFNVYLERAAGPRGATSPGCTTWPATGRSSWPRSGSTAAATASRRRPRRSSGRSRPPSVGLRGRVRVRVDRRVAPRRARHRRLGLRPGRPAPAPEARARRGHARAFARGSTTPETPSGRAISVVVCTLQRGALAARLPRRARARRLPGLRGDRRQRRLDRPRARRSRAPRGVRLVIDSPRTSGLSAARNLGARGGDRRDRRLPRRRRAAGPGLAALPRRALRRDRPRRASAARTSPPPRTASSRDCVANAPGGPVHVLRRRRASPSTCPAATWPCGATRCPRSDGFDPRFRIAGDDVDVCWRLQDGGRDDRLQPRGGGLAPPPRRRCAPTCASSATTAAPRGCSSASGPSATTAPATCAGPGASTARARPARGRRARGCGYGTVGQRACSSRSTSRRRRHARRRCR